MARNRKSQSPAIRFVPALKAILLCALLGASSVGYVLQKNKIFELGNQIQDRESRLETLKRDNLLLQSRLAERLSPTSLQEALDQYGLDLRLPQPDQMIWLSEPTLNNNTNDVPPLLVYGNGVSRPVMK
jgi:hypothetical protein